MTRDEFNDFLLFFIGAAILLAIFNFARIGKKGASARRMALASLMLAVAAGAYRQEGTFGPTTIVCTVLLVLTLLLDVLLRAKGGTK